MNQPAREDTFSSDDFTSPDECWVAGRWLGNSSDESGSWFFGLTPVPSLLTPFAKRGVLFKKSPQLIDDEPAPGCRVLVIG